MVLFSNRESIRNQEVSALSIVETLLAVCSSILIFYYLGYVEHIAFSAALAPLLLMRTPRSTEITLTYGYIVCRIVHLALAEIGPDSNRHKQLVFIFLILGWFLVSNILGVLAAVATKIAVSFFCILIHPIEALGNVPENWRKLVLCTDSATFPEIIPGIDDLSDHDPRRGLQEQFSLMLWKKKAARTIMLTRLLTALVFLPAWIPGLVYRWPLKSTALIWSPFVWAFSPIRGDDDPAIFARGIIDLSIFKFARLYSAIVIAFLWLRFLSCFYGCAYLVLSKIC